MLTPYTDYINYMRDYVALHTSVTLKLLFGQSRFSSINVYNTINETLFRITGNWQIIPFVVIVYLQAEWESLARLVQSLMKSISLISVLCRWRVQPAALTAV